MRKALILCLVGIVAVCVSVYIAMSSKSDFEPYAERLARFINTATLLICQDNDFNTEVKVPYGFVVETDTATIASHYTRYAFYPKASNIDADGHILIEYLASVCADDDALTAKIDSVVRPDGYVSYAKSVRKQRMKFTYRLTYSLQYDACVARLRSEVREWKAFSPNRPKMKGVIDYGRKRMKTYHSGFAIDQQPPAYTPSAFE